LNEDHARSIMPVLVDRARWSITLPRVICWPTTISRSATARCEPGCVRDLAYCAPAVLTRERSQSDSAYFVRRIPSLSSTTAGRHRACQAERASASAFCSSGVSGGAARMTFLPLMLASVAWLGVRGRPAAMAAALARAAAADALAALTASAACPWSIAHEGCCADAVEIQATAKSKAHEIVRIFTKPLAIETEASRAALCYSRNIEGA
jgi:hypothetical protein